MVSEAAPAVSSERAQPAGARTIAALWRDAAAQRRPGPAYLVETPEGWAEVSWEEAARRVDELANGLLASGIRKGDTFGILASTRLEWALADFALALVGAVSVPVYPSSSARDCAYVLEHSRAVGVLVEDVAQREKVEPLRSGSGPLQHVLTFGHLDALAERGRAYAAEHPRALAEAEAAIEPDDLYTIIYTSGTTGPPKGCLIRHRNYHSMVACVDRLEGFLGPDDTMLLYLPLAHNFGRLMHLAGPYVGLPIALLPDPLRVGEALPQVRPTVLPSVPRVFEKVHAAVRAQLDAATGTKRRLLDWALDVGRRASPYRQRGLELPRALAAQHALADRLVYRKIKDRLGGRLRFGISGGAPLAQEIAEFFHALDVLILEGYGLTECTTAATVNRPASFRFGTVGPALPGFELRIADDGEVLIRSDTIFAGYLRDDAATAEVLTDDGWLRSGDIGELDADGFLRITDRKKDIIVTAGGKNVAPQNLENALKTSPLVSQALVVGDRRPYLTALVTLDQEALAAWAREHGVEGGDAAALAGAPEVRAAVQEIVDAVNRDRSRYDQIKRFAILPRDFTAEEGEVTPTLKLRRRVVEEHFAAELDALYAE